MNQKPLFLAVTLAALLVIGGAFCFMSQRPVAVNQPVVTDPVVETPVQTEPEVPSVSDWKPQQQVAKTFSPVVGENGWVWFPVPELGIEIKVKKDIAEELVYQVKKWDPEKDILSAEFTTKKLSEIERRLYGKSDKVGTRNVCTIGTFTRYNMPEKDYMAMQEETYGEGNVTPVSTDGYFVEYSSPQSPCGSDQGSQDGQYENSLMGVGSWWGGSKSEYTETQNYAGYLKKAIRKTK